MAIPSWAVCDGGHGSAAGCAQLLLPSAAERLYLFGARPQGIPESFLLSWSELGRTSPVQAVQFWPLADNSWTEVAGWEEFVSQTSTVRQKRLGGSNAVPWFRGRERSDWPLSVSRQSEEMSNFVQPHDGGGH